MRDRLEEILARDDVPGMVETYFESYTGSRFERFAALADPDEFEASDILAVSMLSVDIPPRVSAWLLDEGRRPASALLAAIPNENIWSVDREVLGSEGKAHELWYLLRSQQWKGKGRNGMGWVKTSKLMAAKRPGLIPIWDKEVARALQLSKSGPNYWLEWHDVMSTKSIRDRLTEIGELASVGDDVTLLRIADVSVWMYQKRRSAEGAPAGAG